MTRNKVVLFDASFSASKLYFALKSKRVAMVPKDLIATISRYANSISRQHMTPHIAFNTETAVKNMVKMSTENLISFQNAGVSDNEITK